MPVRLQNSAFTLIELLVVIAIIAILAAILFPVFAQAKFAAKKTQTLSNAKQIVLSTIMYSNDYDDAAPLIQSIVLPSTVGALCFATSPTACIAPWPVLVNPYIKSTQLFVDPIGEPFGTKAPYFGNYGAYPVPALDGATNFIDASGIDGPKNTIFGGGFGGLSYSGDAMADPIATFPTTASPSITFTAVTSPAQTVELATSYTYDMGLSAAFAGSFTPSPTDALNNCISAAITAYEEETSSGLQAVSVNGVQQPSARAVEQQALASCVSKFLAPPAEPGGGPPDIVSNASSSALSTVAGYYDGHVKSIAFNSLYTVGVSGSVNAYEYLSPTLSF